VRATILYGIVGLIGISALSGCGLFPGWRGDGNENGTGTAVARRVYVAPEPPTPIAPAKVSSSLVVINQYPGSAASPSIATAPSMPAPPVNVPPPSVPARVQTNEPAPIQVDFTPQAKADRAPPASVAAVAVAPQKAPAVAVPRVDVPQERTEKFWTVTGTVEAFRKNWRVRYAAIDHEDRYGGVVVLDGGAELNQRRDGVMVRVRGTLVPPTERTGSAHFRVHELQILD
jgi:hypothetical protein